MDQTLNGWPRRTSPKPQGPCVECRKRKLKCSKTYPCLNCQADGRADACLQSSVVKGTRSLKPSQVSMQEDLTVMSVRKDMLEAALAELQATISSEPHPLLVTDSQIRTASPVPGLSRANDAGTHDDDRDPPDTADELAEAFGMMSIKHDGKQQYHGDFVTSEYVVREDAETNGRESVNEPIAKRRPQLWQLPPEIILQSTLFPFAPKPEVPPDMGIFLHYLPTYERALELLENYYTCFAWSAMVLTPSAALEEVFGVFYPNNSRTTRINPKDAQRLAVLFMIFLLGTLYDIELDIQRYPTEVEEFHNLARAAAVIDPIADNPTVFGVQTLVLIIWYFRLFPGRRSSGYQWGLSGILAKLVIATGLHRDHSSAMPNPKDRLIYEQTFWEYNAVDIWQSFMFGRPASLSPTEFDCKIPHQVEVPPGQVPEFFPWKYSFAILVSRVMSHVSPSSPYTEVMKFDTMLKEHYTPESLTWPPDDVPLGKDEALGKTFQRYITAVWRNVSIMYLHRRIMMQTISEHREEAMQTQFWYSVVSAYNSALALTSNMRRLWLVHRRHVERMAPFWSHAHSAALVLCALAARIPRWEGAKNALDHIDLTCDMFAEAKDSLQPSNALSSLQRYQSQAHYAFEKSGGSSDRKMKMDGISAAISPGDTQFPFEFADSPPRSLYGSMQDGSTGFPTVSPVDSKDAVFVTGGQVALPYGGGMPAVYGTDAQWGKYLVDMGVHY